MNNIVTTIPKSKFKTWEVCERTCRMCNGEPREDGDTWWWLINTQRIPAKDIVGSVCFMIYDGMIRGYFDIVDINPAKEWHDDRTGYSIIMANWHPYEGPEMKGFQGWRYSALQPWKE